MDFSDLEAAIATQSWEQTPGEDVQTEELQDRMHQFQNATLEEIRELMETAVESYALLSPSLPDALKHKARREIEFLEGLFQARLNTLILTFRGRQSSDLDWQMA